MPDSPIPALDISSRGGVEPQVADALRRELSSLGFQLGEGDESQAICVFEDLVIISIIDMSQA